ncbi:nucleotide-binding protein [Noviherbaspirillum aerium]
MNVQNTKRGVGKTTVVVGLHQCLSSPPHRVLTIDADPAIQCKYADS